MATAGLHLTLIGNGAMLLEPSRALDVANAGPALEEIIRRLQRAHAQRLYYDLAELALIEPLYYNWLNALARACHTINVRMVCIHMQPTAAFAMARYMEGNPAFDTALEVEEWNKDRECK